MDDTIVRVIAMILATLSACLVLQVAPALMVRGNQLVDRRGKAVRLQGVNVPSMEWSNEGDTKILESVRVAIQDWKANTIRLPLAQDRWFGKAPFQSDKGEAYRKRVDELVDRASALGAYILLDLHWSDAGEWGKNIAQHKMPDDGSVQFWYSCAKRYANRAHVLFDLYNEPRDVSWDIWRHGGNVEEDGRTYHSPGMQVLYDTVRATGAKNVVMVAGLDWGYDLSGVLRGYALVGEGIAYEAHIYPWKTAWDEKVGTVAMKAPVLIGEVGCEPDPKQEDPLKWGPKVLDWIDRNRLSWTAWCFHPDASPRLLSDWNYTPTPYWGALVKARLGGGPQ